MAGRRRRAGLAGSMLFLGLLVAAVLVAWSDLEVRRDAGQRYVQALADSHAREVGHALAAVQRDFRGVGDALATVGGASPSAVPAVLDEVVAAIVRRNPSLADVRLESSAPPFARDAGTESRRLQLGLPAPDADGTWRLPVAMVLPNPEGTAAGWLRGELDVGVFSSVLGIHDVGEHGVASVLGRDGTLLARSDTGALHAGASASGSLVMQALRQAPGGVVQSPGHLDNVVRVVGYRAVEGWPLVATVGIPPKVLYAGWWPFVAALALGILALMAAWGAGHYFLRRAATREGDIRRSLAASEHAVGSLREQVRDAEAQYRFLYEQHPLPAIVYDRERLVVLASNAAAQAQYGHDREAFQGLHAREVLAEGVTVDDLREEIRNHPEAYGRRIWQHQRADGSSFSALVFARDLASFDGRPARLMLALDVTEHVRAERELAWRASHDALTGLCNRDVMLEAIDEAITRDGEGIAVCLVNLDRFKLINDSLGRGVGDEILAVQAARLEQAVGSRDLVAGLGGDEYGIFLRGASQAEAADRAEALRAALSQPVPVQGIELRTTASLGLACHPGDGGSGADLLRAASRAVDQAKREGRNRSVRYHSGLDPRAGERLLLVQELHKALQEKQFELYFQLKFDAHGRPVGMEALLRWRHPERGLLGPAAFMEALEESGLVVQLGGWVLEQAARCWRELERLGHGGLHIAVNISALQVREELVDEVKAVIARYRLPPGVLELELTESVLLANPAAAAGIMHRLGELGISMAIDDFGTGYSSLAYLQHLPLERLKLDQSFVRSLSSSTDSQAIISAVLGMAQALGLAITAEGVETRAQLEWLLARGCDEFQGFLLAGPMPFEQVLARLQAPAA